MMAMSLEYREMLQNNFQYVWECDTTSFSEYSISICKELLLKNSRIHASLSHNSSTFVTCLLAIDFLKFW
jgi:hypothetical protein